jgi:hypothetical protein
MATAFVITDITAIPSHTGADAARPRIGADATPLSGRFSTGMERVGEASANARVGRFSDGMQARFDSPGMESVGRFSTGMEDSPEAPAARRVGSFADGGERVRRP